MGSPYILIDNAIWNNANYFLHSLLNQWLYLIFYFGQKSSSFPGLWDLVLAFFDIFVSQLFSTTYVCAKSLQSRLTLCHPMDYSLPGFSVHGIFQAGIPEWVAISFSKGSFWPRDWTQVSFYAGIFFTLWATNARCLVTGNTHGKCQFVVNQNKTKNTP